ncbi:MAG: type II secretion system protein [Burkholderiaceae bacterium]
MIHQAQRGWSVLELAMVLAIVGLLAWSGLTVLESGQARQDRDRALQQAEAWRDRLRTFALNNRRLPCPDLTGQGWEGDAAGSCGAAVTGWLPYRALGLDLPAEELRAAYAVFRLANVTSPDQDADLAVQRERTGDAPGSLAYQDVWDLVRGLNNATALAAAQAGGVITTQPYLTGNGGQAGAIDCAGLPRDNFAFRLLVPLKDRDGDASRFDGVHTLQGLCSEAPGAAMRHTQDDVVLAEGFGALAGWLQARAW